jgi:hypothetical protein
MLAINHVPSPINFRGIADKIMKWKILANLLVCVIGVTCLAAEPAVKPTKAEAIAKAKAWLQANTYSRSILDAHTTEDLLNPENKVYRNTVSVSDDLTEVRFEHNGRPYDSPSFAFNVKLKRDLSLVSIQVQITPGGYLRPLWQSA